MRSNLLKHCVTLVTAGCVTITGAMAAGGSFTRGCAARDMQIMMLLEQSEGSNGVSAKTLNEALLTMMHARMVCFEGNIPAALAIYDDIARSITVDPASSATDRFRY
jgi:hypothetical protein